MKETEMSDDYDVKLLGEKLPGSPRERAILLKWLRKFVAEKGEDWVRESRNRLLAEAEEVVNLGL
jgi:hypothetical protein